ncbi:MAG TPA: glycosyltransferase family 4 protein [Methylomirabilota bacterium]|nr:glycosyltransferase family 4 protein [Methylomirabilota bacterium]
MTTLRSLAASAARRLARLPEEVRAAEAALAAGDADRAIALTDPLVRARPDDRVVLAFRRRAFAARGDQTGVAATIAALRRTRGGDDLIDSERRLHGDLAETDPRWRPRVRGPRRPTAPRSDRVVLHLLKESLPQRQTGFTMRSHANLLAQRAAGWDPVVVTALGFPRSGGEDVRTPEEIDGIRHHRLDLGPGYPEDGPVDTYLEDYAWRAAAVAREERPAIVHASSGGRGYESALVGLALGEHLDVPVVYEVRSLFDGPAVTGDRAASDATSTRERYRRRDATEVRSMFAADAVVTLAETMKSDIVARGVPADRVFIVPNGVDPEAFLPRPADPALRERYGLGERFVIGYVSNLDHPREGQETLIEATAILAAAGRDVACLIVGEGRRRAELEVVAAGSGASDRIVFTGAVPHDQVPAMYALLDAFVVPRRDERAARLVTPLKPFEAMAMARPLIVADLPALTEVAPHGERSLAYRAENAQALAAAVGRLMDDRALAERLGEAGRAWVTRERTWASNGARWTAIYEGMLTGRRHAGGSGTSEGAS